MAPPLLTPRQWKLTDVAKKPGSSYGGYVNWVTKTRAKRAAAKTARANDPMALYFDALKAAPTTARTSVKTQIDAALAGERAAAKAAQEQADRQATRAQGFATALAELNAPRANEISDIYQGTEDRMRLYGTGLVSDLTASQQAQAQADADTVRRVTGAELPASPIDNRALQFAGVTIPGTTMAQEGKNARIEDVFLRGARTAGLASLRDQFLQKKMDIQGDLAAKRVALEAQRPKLYQDALKEERDAANSRLATMIQAAYLNNTIRQTGAAITNVDPLTGKPTAEALSLKQQQNNWIQARQDKIDAAKAAGKQISIENSKTVGYLVDGNWNMIPGKDGGPQILPGFRRNKAGQIIPRSGSSKDPLANDPRWSNSDLREWGKIIGPALDKAYKGQRNKYYDSNAKEGDYVTDADGVKIPKWKKYTTPPMRPSIVMQQLRSMSIPYEVIYRAMVGYAKRFDAPPNWKDVLHWQGPKMGGVGPKKKPPKKK